MLTCLTQASKPDNTLVDERRPDRSLDRYNMLGTSFDTFKSERYPVCPQSSVLHIQIKEQFSQSRQTTVLPETSVAAYPNPNAKIYYLVHIKTGSGIVNHV